MLARLQKPALPCLGGMGRGSGLRLRFQVGEIGLTEGALNNLEVEGQIRSQFGVERIEQETTQLLAVGACQARAVPDSPTSE